MYVKKNLMLWVAVFALALPFLLVGNAFALYPGDGSKMVPAGGWDITDKGVCVTGVMSDGTINIGTATSNPDCIATVVNATTTSAACTSFANANGSGAWTSTCVGADGTVISLNGLDRTAASCNQRSAALGHGAGAMASRCTGSWQYLGAAGNGAPGFAYTKVRVSNTYPAQTDCPTTTPGYTWATATGTGTNKVCNFTYGISGIASADIKKKDGTVYIAGNTAVDLSAMTSQGVAMANGIGWSTGTTKTGTTAVAADSAVIANVNMARQGCLECHNTMSQRNGYAERWKESYLKTGHKNMLRKVTAGTSLIGPDGAAYTTTDLAHNTDSIDFAAGTYTAGSGATAGVAKQLFYIYGDWMAAAPSVVYNNSLTDATASNGYSCAACHTTGFANSSAGVCTDSSKKTAALCVAPATWVASVGLEGVNGAEPAASFPGIKSITGTWQKDGITCARCHNTTFPAIAGATVAETTGDHNNGDIIVGKNVINLCYGCHQSPATVMPAAAAVDLNHPEFIPVKNTSTVMDASNPNGYIPEFNGHVLGNSFLNSAHGKFTGTITPNKLGKYNIASGTYASTFKGKYCRTSNSIGGGSIMKTKVNATTGAAEIIKGSADCTAAGGYWVDAGTTTQGTQGSCTTCHDVHQSIVPEVGAEEPLVRECETCHENTTDGYGAPQVEMANMVHPTGAGTPFDTNLFKNACEACHMPKATSGGFPIHLWRISTDANYSTFPSKAAFYGGSCSVKTSAADVSATACATAGGVWTAVTKDLNAQVAPDGAYANATWIDVDIACGQCHNSTGSLAGAKDLGKGTLATFAKGIHDGTQPVACTDCHKVNHVFGSAFPNGPQNCTTCHSINGTNHDGAGIGATIDCGQCHTNGTNGAPKIDASVLDSMKKSIHNSGAGCETATVGSTISVAGNVVTLTDTSTHANDITINWGDGTSETVAAGFATAHTYSTRAATYTIKQIANACISATKIAKVAVAPVKYTVTVTVSGGTNVTLGMKKKNPSSSRVGTVAVHKGVTNSDTFSVAAGTYRIDCKGGTTGLFDVTAPTPVNLTCK